ncbi:MAG: CDP-diacylglycerol--serine O-phosphatidyltransferase [Nitrospinota bacterium]|nr:CDP-diacylglycerol--serine O-phosphatidyltransferase [Nitrospinota bacterium]
MDELQETDSPKLGNRLKKGVYLLPSLITTMGFFSGFYALIAVFNENYYYAAWAIIFAGLCDFLDGKVARMTNTTSEFGMQYDSMSDLMAFGIAPAFLAYSWVLQPYGRVGWMAAFLYAICGALRLARFNTHASTGTLDDKFLGLPIPAAAGFIATLVILTKDFLVIEKVHPMIIVATVYMLAFLMVSNIRYISFKKLGFSKRRPFRFLVSTILFIYVIATIPELMLFVMAVIYVSSGPVDWIYRRWFKKNYEEEEPISHI